MRVEKLYKVKQENTKTELNTHFFFFLKENRIIVLRPHRMENSSWQEKNASCFELSLFLALSLHFCVYTKYDF